jgi:hypothetical protein
MRPMTTTRLASLLTLAALALAPLCLAGAADEKLGEAYTKAAPAQRMVLLSIALADKTVELKDVRTAVEETVRAAIAPGETAQARLELHGKLRADAEAALKTANEERKKAGGRAASFYEPDNDTQLALAIDYVAAVAGDKPTLDELACLKLVRECTAWAAHTKLVTALLTEALDRDATYAAADLEARLTTIRALAQEKQMMSDQERTYLENALLSEHVSASLAAGHSIADIRARIKGWSDKKLICFFTRSFIDGVVERLGELRAAKE